MSYLLGGHISRLKSGVLCPSSSVVHTTYLHGVLEGKGHQQLDRYLAATV